MTRAQRYDENGKSHGVPAVGDDIAAPFNTMIVFWDVLKRKV
jgi:hypothetical protein